MSSVLFKENNNLHGRAKENLKLGYHSFFNHNKSRELVNYDEQIKTIQEICSGPSEKADPSMILLKA